jgi:hypothetical protein
VERPRPVPFPVPFVVKKGSNIRESVAVPGPPRGLVEAAAEWSAAFLEEAGRVLDEAGAVDAAQATVMMEPALRAAGFYRALEAARAKARS